MSKEVFEVVILGNTERSYCLSDMSTSLRLFRCLVKAQTSDSHGVCSGAVLGSAAAAAWTHLPVQTEERRPRYFHWRPPPPELYRHRTPAPPQVDSTDVLHTRAREQTHVVVPY